MLESHIMEAARLAYGERIIRCTNQDPRLVENFLGLDGQIEKSSLWIACAYAKRQGEPNHVRGLLTYLFSHVGPLDPERRAWLIDQIERNQIGFHELTQEMLVGTYLEWSHVFRLAGGEFNPTRVKERVRRLYQQALERELPRPGGDSRGPLPVMR